MATFQFSRKQVELDFCEEVKCTVPLTDDVQKSVQNAAKYLLDATKKLTRTGDNAEDMQTLCDYVMDAIDDILGEGMADKILGLKEGYTFWDAADVFKYITDEINGAFRDMATAYGGKNVAAPVAAPNRAARRAAKE